MEGTDTTSVFAQKLLECLQIKSLLLWIGGLRTSDISGRKQEYWLFRQNLQIQH